MMKKLVFGVVLFCLFGLLCPLSVSAADEVTYTEEQKAIYAKVEELARLKALGTPRANTDHIEQYMQELNDAGAIPDDKLLAELTFDKSFQGNGMRIENMADFREAYTNVLDIFAVHHTATVLHRDYEVYEIIIQEVVRDRSGSLNMLEILSTSSYRHVFTNAATEPTWREDFIKLITKGTDSSKTIKNDSTSGYSRSFTVQTVLQPTLHMIFVKRYGSDEWKHTLTTHSIALLEYYDWHYVTSESKYRTIHNEERKIEDVLHPSGYDTRLHDAITAYRRETSKPEFEAIGQYENLLDITAMSGLSDHGKDVFFEYRLDIPCPATPEEIAKLVKRVEREVWWRAFYREHRNFVWIGAAVIAIPIFWGISTLLERRVRRWSYQRWKKKQEQ